MTSRPTAVVVHDPRLPDRLRHHVRVLAEQIGDRSSRSPAALDQAARYLTQELTRIGYQVQEQAYTASGQTFKNLMVESAGRTAPHEVILVGAHYDTCDTPGADDNASGVAGLLELARMTAGRPNHRTLRVVAFANEEPPFFRTPAMGSRVYASAAKARHEQIRAALILEMIGYYSTEPGSQQYPPVFNLLYPNQANFIGVVSNLRHGWLAHRIAQTFRRHSSFPIHWIAAPSVMQGIDWSDHWSFWKEGYPAVMMTDTSFFRNPHYHQPTDRWDTLDYERMAAVVEGLAATIRDLAGAAHK